MTRAELFESDRLRKQVTWYDLRATGITWRAIPGDNPIAIMHQAGHEDFETTQGYIREAESLGATFAGVFPALPSERYETSSGEATATENRIAPESLRSDSNRRNPREKQWVDGDSNPGPTD